MRVDDCKQGSTNSEQNVHENLKNADIPKTDTRPGTVSVPDQSLSHMIIDRPGMHLKVAIG